MKCKTCKTKERECKRDVCSSCRLKKWRKDNPEKVKAYAKMRYVRDRKKILESSREYAKNNPKKMKTYAKKRYWDDRENILSDVKERQKKNGYASDKRPERREDARIRRATRRKYPLQGNTCKHCSKPANHHHHTTKPIAIDKFIFLCRKHHNKIHGKGFAVYTTDETEAKK